MSKKEKDKVQNKEQEQGQKDGKVMTKYDLKMQRRREAKEKEKREKKISMIAGVVIVAALVCLVASFPIRTYLAVHETYCMVNGEEISRAEFDYNYSVVKNNFINQYGTYLSYFGLNPSEDLSKQMYSDTLTWKDYFEQQTVDSIIRSKALKAQAQAAGFTYDTENAFKEFKQGVNDTASEQGITVKELLRQMYGSYATFGRVEEYVKETSYVNEYYSQVSAEKEPSDEEIQAYYEEHKQEYDSIDYYQTLIQAELPTEPTELADPVEEGKEDASAEANKENGSTEAENTEETYTPSEAEVEKAMADAKKLTEDAEKNVKTEGELKEGIKYVGVPAAARDWLFDEARKEGDTTVIEDTTGNQYYVLSFVKHYLDETPSADMRIIMTEGGNGQTVLEEWKNGEATEESFGKLADQYNKETTFTAEGGYYEAVTPSGTQQELAGWLFDAGRAAGDSTVISTEAGSDYVLYYVGQNDPEWMLNVRSLVLSDIMESYLQEISEGITVEDPKGHLNYLKVPVTDNTGESQPAETTEGTEEESESAEIVEGTEEESGSTETIESTEE